jgi:hypothetical protein
LARESPKLALFLPSFSELSAYISIGDTAEYWRVALNSIVSVQEDKKYTLIFWAKSSTSRYVFIQLMRDTEPWDGYGLWAISMLSNFWNKYEYTFTCTTTDSLARLGFCVGHDTSSIWLDGVILRQIE